MSPRLLGDTILLELHGRHRFAYGERHFPCKEHQEEQLHWPQGEHAEHLQIGIEDPFRFIFRWQGLLGPRLQARPVFLALLSGLMSATSTVTNKKHRPMANMKPESESSLN